MLQAKLDDGLARYQIGDKLRALRLKKKMGLVELGKATGLSSAMLSKIERGRLFPTLRTLLRIATVFGVGLGHFFANEPGARVAIVRKKDRLRVPSASDGNTPAYHFEPFHLAVADHRLNAYYAEFEDEGNPRERHSHPGAEFLFVLSGKLLLGFEDGEHLLESGDAIYFESSRPHGYARASLESCAAVVVLTP